MVQYPQLVEISTDGEFQKKDVLKESRYGNIVAIEGGKQQAFMYATRLKNRINKKPADVICQFIIYELLNVVSKHSSPKKWMSVIMLLQQQL